MLSLAIRDAELCFQSVLICDSNNRSLLEQVHIDFINSHEIRRSVKAARGTGPPTARDLLPLTEKQKHSVSYFHSVAADSQLQASPGLSDRIVYKLYTDGSRSTTDIIS